MDKDGNGCVSKEEAGIMDALTKYLGVMELRKTYVNFGHLDTDLSECWTLDELKAHLLEYDLPEDEIIEIFNLAEHNSDGCVTVRRRRLAPLDADWPPCFYCF